MDEFFRTLETQRWDDHRLYHHSRINQSLHLVSALSFLLAYGLLFVDPPLAAIVAWCVSMTTRQAGHFFFEPRGFDEVNWMSDAMKEKVKVGYNIRRKAVLMSIWLLVPILLALAPADLGLATPADGAWAFVREVGWAWLALGVAGLAFRIAQLWWEQDLTTGLAWGFKILTDPFCDIKLYYKAPLALLRGELIDPMPHARRPR